MTERQNIERSLRVVDRGAEKPVPDCLIFEQIDPSSEELLEALEKSEIGVGMSGRRHLSKTDYEIQIARCFIELTRRRRAEERECRYMMPLGKPLNVCPVPFDHLRKWRAHDSFSLSDSLTPSDLAELERILLENGVGTADDLRRAGETNHGLGLFVRSLVGLDRGAAKDAFAGFLSGKALNANQIEFVDLIINHLTENGAMDPALLYSSPYTDFSPHGVEGVFTTVEATEIVGILRAVRGTAA